MQQLFQQWSQSHHRGFSHSFLFCNSLALTWASSHLLLSNTWRSKHCCGQQGLCNCISYCKWILRGTCAAKAAEINAGITLPPAVLQVYWAHFPVLSFPFLCPTFRHYIGYLGISLITPPYPCSLTSLDYHHYLKQQWPLLILSRSLQRAPGNLGALILQQFGADTSKTHDFNKEECWTSRSVSKKLQEEHEIRRQESVYRTDKMINTRVLSSKSSNKTYFSFFSFRSNSRCSLRLLATTNLMLVLKIPIWLFISLTDKRHTKNSLPKKRWCKSQCMR